MAITRTINEGPAAITYNGYTYYSEGTITLTPDLALRDITSSYYGPIDARVTDKAFTLKFTPVGMCDTQSAYFPYTNADIGKLIAPATDKPLIIYTAAGTKITISAAVIIGCPQLLLATDKGPMGEMTFGCLGDLNKIDAASAECYYKIEAAAIAAHSLDPATIPTPAYKLTIGETEYDSEEGFTFDLGMTTEPRKVNRYGTVNFKLTALRPTLSFTPFGPTESAALALLAMQGAGAALMGHSNRMSQSLTLAPVSGHGITIEFDDCQVREGSMLFSASDPRHGQYVILPVIELVAGAPQPLYSITFPTYGD